jgi:urease accessory protein
MITLTHITGNATDHELAHRLHDLEHAGRIEHLVLSKQDTQRHRLRATTDRGTEVAIAIARDQHLANGSVFLPEPDRAIVVRVQEQEWLALRAPNAAAALEVGYFAGNMHWKVNFDGDVLRIALEGPRQRYLERIAHLVDARKARVLDA